MSETPLNGVRISYEPTYYYDLSAKSSAPDGYVLTSNGPHLAPSWQAPPTN